jgi:hypothetical protein
MCTLVRRTQITADLSVVIALSSACTLRLEREMARRRRYFTAEEEKALVAFLLLN